MPDDEPTTPDASATDAAPTRRRRATRKAASPAGPAGDSGTATTDSAADELTTPAKKAARKATKRTAKKAAPVAEPPAGVTADPPTAEATEPVPAPAAKKATKRTSKKAAAAAADPFAVPAPEQAATAAEQAAPEPPAKAAKKASRRAAKKAAPASDAALLPLPEPAGDVAAPAPIAEDATEAVPTRRRRAARKAAPAVSFTPPAVAFVPPAADTTTAADTTSAAGNTAAAPESTPSTDDDDTDAEESGSRRRRRGRRGRGRGRSDGAEDGTSTESSTGGTPDAAGTADESGQQADGSDNSDDDQGEGGTKRRRRRRSRRTEGEDADQPQQPAAAREPRKRAAEDEVKGVRGSTRLEAKRQRRRDGRDNGRKRPPIVTESEFLARRESVDRVMAVRQAGERTQIAVLEDGVLVEHYVTKASSTAYAGNIYLGRVQNVLPSMEAAFIDIGKGRNAVLYAGEVNFDAAGLGGKPRRIEEALKSGQPVLVQVTKDPIGHKGARLTSQISLPGRFLVYVPEGSMTGISRRLPDTERKRLKDILKKIVPDDAGVIIRTASEGATEEQLTHDVERLQAQWEALSTKAESSASSAPSLLYGEPDLAIRVVRDVFNEDFGRLVIAGDEGWDTVHSYVEEIAPDLADRLERHTGSSDLFAELGVDAQLAKALDRKVFLPSGGSLVIDRTEAMTVVDVNTGKFTGQGGNLEETVTRNNLEAAEEIVRQLRLRDVGGIIVVDFIDMVLESNRDLVLRRLTECLGRDRTKHQVAEVTSLGLVQMTRQRVGQGLLEAFSEPCEVCHGSGVIVHNEPVALEPESADDNGRSEGSGGRSRGRRGRKSSEPEATPPARSATELHRMHAAAVRQPDEPTTADTPSSTLDRQAASGVPAPEATSGNVGPQSSAAAEPGTSGPADTSEPPEDLTDTADDISTGTIPGLVGAELFGGEDVTPETPRPRRRRAASRPAGPPVDVADGRPA